MNIGRVVLIGVIAIVLLSALPTASSSGQVRSSVYRNVVGIGKLNAWIDTPNQIKVRNTTIAKVVVVNNVGNEINGAYVNLSLNNSNIQIFPASGYTNSKGEFQFTIKGICGGFTKIWANVSYNGLTAETNSTIEVVSFSAQSLTVTADKYSLNPDDSVNIYVTVVDQYGKPVSGANVSVDTSQVGYGTISPSNATTDSNGIAKFTYTAPSSDDMVNKYVNMHTIAKLVFTANKEGYELANTVTMRLVTYNKNPSKWYIVRAKYVSNWTVNTTNYGGSLTTNIHLFAQNLDGTPLRDWDISLKYSNETYLLNPPSSVTPDGNGWANFTLQFRDGLPTKVVRIKFYIPAPYCIGDSVDILYWNGDVGVPLYGGHITADPFMVSDNKIVYTVELYNNTNRHPIGDQVIGTVLSSTPDGMLGDIEQPFFDTEWEYVGINIYGNYSDSAIGIDGEWNGIADNTKKTVHFPDLGINLTTAEYLSMWYGINMTPQHVINGTATFNITRHQSTYRDLVGCLCIVTGGLTYYITDPSVNNFVMYGNQTLKTDIGYQRAMSIEIANISVQPVGIPGKNFTVYARLYNESNTPIAGETVKVYNYKYATRALFPATNGTTNSDGSVVITPQTPKLSSPTEVNVYVKGEGNATTYSVLDSTQIAVKPNETYINANFNGNVLWNKTHLIINATLLNNESQPLSGKNITVMIENDTYWNFTSSDGSTEFNISLEKYHGIVPVYVEFGEGGYRYSMYTFYIFTTGGDINFTDLNYPNYVVLNSNGNITVRVNSTFDLQWVVIYIKSPSSSNFQGYVMSRVGSTNVYYYNTTYDEEGNYEFYIEAVDIHNYVAVTSQHTIQASSQIPELPLLPLSLIVLFAIIAFIQRRHSLLSTEGERKSF